MRCWIFVVRLVRVIVVNFSYIFAECFTVFCIVSTRRLPGRETTMEIPNRSRGKLWNSTNGYVWITFARVSRDRNLILVRGRSSGSEGLRTFPGARSSGWIVHSILAVPFFPPLTFLLATPSSSLEQTRSSHSSDSAPASNPATFPRSHTTLISGSTREKRTPMWQRLFRSVLLSWSGDTPLVMQAD